MPVAAKRKTMLFNSWSFMFAFMPLVLAAYWLMRACRWHRGSVLFLAVASYVFYLLGEPHYPLLLIVSIAMNFGFGRVLAGAPDGSGRKRLFVLAIGANLLALGIFKYCNFFTQNLPGSWGVEVTSIALPVGISFFTFTQIAFLVDVYHRKAKDFDPVRYALFVTFFPHLIAGPILHHGEMMPQFAKDQSDGLRTHLWAGLAMFTIGLAKKVLIADTVAPAATGVFDGAAAGTPMHFTLAWSGALAYTAQIYFDFSGYSDMALGLSRMFGIRLPINFNSPYQATSIVDFWRRWHITLSRFLRDYLYVALGGNRKGPVRRYLNLLATMVLGGIWHGAGWTFLLWGLLHGLYLIVNHGWVALRERLGLPALPWLLGWALTFVAVVFAWVPFRAADFTSTMVIWKAMLSPSVSFDAIWGDLVGKKILLALALALLVALLAPNSQQILYRYDIGLDSPGYRASSEWRPATDGVSSGPMQWRVSGVGVLLIGIAFGLSLRFLSGYSEFIYFRF